MPNRRTVMRTSLAALALAPIGAAGPRADDATAAETASGKIRGTRSGDLHVFKGIPYGASTAGANRFMPPRKPEPWTGVRDATVYAGRSPQAGAGAQRPELATLWGVRDSPARRRGLPDAERLDARRSTTRSVPSWSGCMAAPSPTARPTRPGMTAAASPGAMTSSSCRVNHRLNIFGHLDLSASGDERFAQSGNAGVLDLVAALEWVREHAARFGGDPGNVTIFGQSGGGGKVSALLAMPGAKGLFHKAIIQSGAGVRFAERERTTRLADAVLKQLELGPAQFDALQALPIARLTEAIGPAQKTLPPPRHALLDRYNFGPVIDGQVLPAHPFDPAASALSDDVPLMIGGTKDEFGDLPGARRRRVEPHARRGGAAQAHRRGRGRGGRQPAGLLQAARSRRDAVRSPDHRAHRGELPGALDACWPSARPSAPRPPSGCTGSTGRRRRSAAA